MIHNSALLRIACWTELVAKRPSTPMMAFLWMPSSHSAYSPSKTTLMARPTMSAWPAPIKIRPCSLTSQSVNWIAMPKGQNFAQMSWTQRKTRLVRVMVVSNQCHLQSRSRHYSLQLTDLFTLRITLQITLLTQMRNSVQSSVVNFSSQIAKLHTNLEWRSMQEHRLGSLLELVTLMAGLIQCVLRALTKIKLFRTRLCLNSWAAKRVETVQGIET